MSECYEVVFERKQVVRYLIDAESASEARARAEKALPKTDMGWRDLKPAPIVTMTGCAPSRPAS